MRAYRLTLALVGSIACGMAACGSSDPSVTSSGGGADNGGSSGAIPTTKNGDAGSARGGGSVNSGANTGRPLEADAGDQLGNDPNACEKLQLPAHPNAPEIMIVLDRSGSTIGSGPGGAQRWDPSVSAVKKLTSSLTGSVEFGLMLFPSPGGGGGRGLECTPGKVDVPVNFNTAAMIAAKLDMSRPTQLSATPTADTLVAAKAALDVSLCADCIEPPKYVLLVTDGKPNCGDGTAMETQADIDDTIAAIDALAKDGIKTYVVGYDTAKDAMAAAAMNSFAMHGGTGMQYPVENEETLVDELTRIAGSLVPYEFELTQNVNDASFVRVEIDGVTYVNGTDWTLVDGKKVVLNPMGGACPILRDAKVHLLNITRECDPVL